MSEYPATFLLLTEAVGNAVNRFLVAGMVVTLDIEFHYDLSRSCDEIRPTYHHVESCQETVPEAITAFLEGDSFEDVIRTAVSLGGDCDTLTAIAGSIAEGFYGVPENLREECQKRLPEPLDKVLVAFEEYLERK